MHYWLSYVTHVYVSVLVCLFVCLYQGGVYLDMQTCGGELKQIKLSTLLTLLCPHLPSGAYIWLLFLPAWVLFLILQVNLEDPSLTNFPPPVPLLESFWDAQALGFVILWILFQALLYVLPVGKVKCTHKDTCMSCRIM